jgi:alkylation response protein AidB-like acyl-CoA dehydrogenase
MPFTQSPPRLANQYDDDRVLRSYLKRVLSPRMLAAVEPELRELGELAGGRLYRKQLADRLNEPRHTPFDAWGNRIDHIELTPLWKDAGRLAARLGLVGAAYEDRFAERARVHQFALVHLFHASTDFYTCPLAMTDGAARALIESGNQTLIDRAVPRLTSRDPRHAWTSGQWMTETTGGSDVGSSQSTARRDGQGNWRLYGRKWFTSATTSEMALTLARPEGNPEGGSGLALFYLEPRNESGRLQDVRVLRLKDKLGTRKVPTAELELEGAVAHPVAGLEHGIRNIAPMLNCTRLWNAVGSIATMRRGLALATDYAWRRHAFGRPLAEQPLHRDTLAGLAAEYEAAFHLTFHAVELLGRVESGQADDSEARFLRILTPLVKLTTGRQAVHVTSEAIEAFGGAGYVEDTGLPVLLRDAQVFPIWEGTTNVLALDTLRAMAGPEGMEAILQSARTLLSQVTSGDFGDARGQVLAALSDASGWYHWALRSNSEALEAGARRFALTLGRSLSLALLLRHAEWARRAEQDERPGAAARRFAAAGIAHVPARDTEDAALLLGEPAAPEDGREPTGGPPPASTHKDSRI